MVRKTIESDELKNGHTKAYANLQIVNGCHILHLSEWMVDRKDHLCGTNCVTRPDIRMALWMLKPLSSCPRLFCLHSFSRLFLIWFHEQCKRTCFLCLQMVKQPVLNGWQGAFEKILTYFHRLWQTNAAHSVQFETSVNRKSWIRALLFAATFFHPSFLLLLHHLLL